MTDNLIYRRFYYQTKVSKRRINTLSPSRMSHNQSDFELYQRHGRLWISVRARDYWLFS